MTSESTTTLPNVEEVLKSLWRRNIHPERSRSTEALLEAVASLALQESATLTKSGSEFVNQVINLPGVILAAAANEHVLITYLECLVGHRFYEEESEFDQTDEIVKLSRLLRDIVGQKYGRPYTFDESAFDIDHFAE